MDCLEKDGLDHPFLCPWMDGIPQRARKGGAVVFSNLVTEKCRLKMAHYCHDGFVYA